MTVQCEQSPDAVRSAIAGWRRDGLSVGLVPTMGALHEGHLSLARACVAECDRTVASIFVNPTQFPPGEDLDSYPRRLQEDCRMLAEVGTDLVFAPAAATMYPAGACTYVSQDKLIDRLCGAFRPGHFQGVLTIVAKLFNIIPADRAYFGRKDLQQTVVIRRMVADLDMPIAVRVLPTVREKDGLAMSSRNEYLSADQRRQAVCLYEALTAARERFRAGETSPQRLIDCMGEVIARRPDAKAQYVEIVDPDRLDAVGEVTEDSVGALAVHVGETRLIDNMPFGECLDVFVAD